MISRIALFGPPGAGKSTSNKILSELCKEKSWKHQTIKLAEPLYTAQSTIYEIAGVKLNNFYQQDGELLNFLGYYLRKLNPSVLLDAFSERLNELVTSYEDASRLIIVCDDMRQPDCEHLRNLGFLLVRIEADDELCKARKVARGDVTLGNKNHATEAGLDSITADLKISNNGSMKELRTQIANFLIRDIE